VVGWEKESFRGKAALERERSSGPGRKLWGLIGENRRPLRDGSRLYLPSEEEQVRQRQYGGQHNLIGTITSGGYGPTVGRGIAMALVSTDMEVYIDMNIDAVHEGKVMPAHLTKLPFVPRGRPSKPTPASMPPNEPHDED
jgi:aminomethyltransferase